MSTAKAVATSVAAAGLAESRVIWRGERAGHLYTCLEWRHEGQVSWELFCATNGRPSSLGKHDSISAVLAALRADWEGENHA